MLIIDLVTVKNWISIGGLEVKENQLIVQRLLVQDWQSSSIGAKTIKIEGVK